MDTVEAAVLNGLSAELRHPEVIAQYVQTYHEERKRLAADTDARRSRLERRLEELTREIERLVNAIAKGHADPAVLGPQSTTLNEERKCILAELDQVRGELFGILELAKPDHIQKSDDVMTKGVAGPRNQFCHNTLTVPV